MLSSHVTCYEETSTGTESLVSELWNIVQMQPFDGEILRTRIDQANILTPSPHEITEKLQDRAPIMLGLLFGMLKT